MWLDFDLPAPAGRRLRLECRAGVALGDIVAAVDLPPGPWWCGPQLLDNHDLTGDGPLPHGALISPHATAPGPHWPGLRLVSITGPDAGRARALTRVTALGSAPRAGWRDRSIDAHHATAELHAAAHVMLTDAGSTNGLRAWDPATPYRWRPRRRRLALAPGGCAALGATVVQLRDSTPTAPRMPTPWLDAHRALHLTTPDPATLEPATRAPTAPARAPWHDEWWRANLVVTGPHREGVTRAIILSRGRQLPSPSPLTEPWQQFLAPADAHDGSVRWSPPRGSSAALEVDTTGRVITVRAGPEKLRIPLYAVAADTADLIARAAASTRNAVPPLLTRGDLPRSAGLVIGAVDGDGTWSLPADRSWCVLITGAASAGKTTALATIATAALTEARPYADAVLLFSRHRIDTPGVTDRVVWHAPEEAVARLHTLADYRGRALVIIDDVDLLDPVTLDAAWDLARRRDDRVSVVYAATRASGTFPPELLARADAAICLRTATADASRDVIGIDDAAALPRTEPGLAVVRDDTTRRLIRIALPSPEPSAAARVIGVTMRSPHPVLGTSAASPPTRRGPP